MAYLILGYNKTGIAVEKWCLENSIKNYCFDDNKDVKYSNKFSTDKWSEIDKVIVSPGFRTVYNRHPMIQDAIDRKIEIVSDLDIFYEFRKNRNCKIIGVTGTNGKSTTAAMIYHILSSFGLNVELCGNFGSSPLKNLDADFYIIEISSGQLEISSKIMFDISIITNITPDHFDYHGDMETYVHAKHKIVLFSEKIISSSDILNIFNSNSLSVDNISVLDHNNVCNIVRNNVKLFGEHNIMNAAFAFEICKYLKLDVDKILSAISTFKGLEHRMEMVKIDSTKIIFINDSKSTTPDSTFTALDSLKDFNVYLIVGGYKKSRTIHFKSSSLRNIKGVFCIGSSANYFYRKFRNFYLPVKRSKVMRNGVRDAILAIKADRKRKSVLLLSPMCASYDQYNNFEERGTDFKNLAKELIHKSNGMI